MGVSTFPFVFLSPTEYLKPMGAENPRRVPFGNKYKFKPDSNPAPGQYDPSKGYNIVK